MRNVRKKSKGKSIEDALLPITIVNWIIGCGGIIEYPLGNPNVIFSLIYSAAYVITYSVLEYLVLSLDYKIRLAKVDNDYNHNNKSFFKISHYAKTIAVFSIIIMSWSRKQGLKLFIEKIKRADELLRKLGISTNYDKMYKTQLCLIAFVIMANVIVITVNWKTATFMCLLCNWDAKIIFSTRYHYSLILQYFTDFNFIGVTWCLKHKFEQLNHLLGKLTETSPFLPQYMKLIYFKTGINKASSIRSGNKTNDDTNIIRISKEVHLDLVKLCKLHNNTFSVQLLISLTLATISIITIFYTTYSEYLISTEVTHYDQIVRTCSTLIYYLVKIFAINYICDVTSHEALRTGSIINELHEPATNKEFRTEIREFTLQLIQNPLRFTAYGFFNLDNTFIQKMVGSVTTYLIFLIQLQDI